VLGQSKERISGHDSVIEVVYKMSDGNPGAISVLAQIMSGEFHGVPGFILMLNLDSIGIYGANIWMLYKDCCGENILEVEKVLRAWQLGKISEEDVLSKISAGQSFDLPTVDEMLNELRIS